MPMNTRVSRVKLWARRVVITLLVLAATLYLCVAYPLELMDRKTGIKVNGKYLTGPQYLWLQYTDLLKLAMQRMKCES